MKYRYALDENNQLLIKPDDAPRFIPAAGRLTLDKDSRLVYWLNKPAPWKAFGLGPKIAFSGSWQLDRNHNFQLFLDSTGSQISGDTLTVTGEIISFEDDCVAFEFKTKDERGLNSIQLFKFSVSWLAGEDGCLNFIVKKQIPDIVTLQSSWKLNRRQQIVYSYTRESLRRKTRMSRELVFDGWWDLGEKDKLVYRLTGGSSKFVFCAQVESASFYPSRGAIKYRLGAGIAKDKRGKSLILYGSWKFGRNLAVGFEAEYGGRLVRSRFTAELSSIRGDRLEFRLLQENGESSGITLKLSRRLLKTKDAEAFLCLKKTKSESAVEAGLKIPF